MVLQRLTPFYTLLEAPVASEPIINKIIFTISFSVLTTLLYLIMLSHQFNNTFSLQRGWWMEKGL